MHVLTMFQSPRMATQSPKEGAVTLLIGNLHYHCFAEEDIMRNLYRLCIVEEIKMLLHQDLNVIRCITPLESYLLVFFGGLGTVASGSPL